ncbi:pheromone processing endoprotease [Basidiobolus ranarum]|uniref:Pheromone processing endoprotease n=1 Tax=Basidiobolus ranarum TaxID=34480 RepID=A0ABR2WAB9_9FUNG
MRCIRRIFLATSVLLLAHSTTSSLPDWHGQQNHDTHEYYTLKLNTQRVSPLEIASLLGIDYVGDVANIGDYHLFSWRKNSIHPHGSVEKRFTQLKEDHTVGNLKKRELQLFDQVEGQLQKQTLKKRVKRFIAAPGPPPPDVTEEPTTEIKKITSQSIANSFGFHDPGFPNQWHLFNDVTLGNDMNITDVWRQGITGENVVVVLLDDGLDMTSDDLKANYFAEGSYDFNNHVAEPKPRLFDDYHGTRCAGEIAAANNTACGVGVAFGAKVAGVRILSGEISDVDEALALVYQNQKNHIFSCSWGPPDDGQSMEAPSELILDSMIKGINEGRGGKGSVFVFATGNGGNNDDNCNFDGYTNSIYTVSIGAADRNNGHPYYSEKCSAQLGVTYSSGNGGGNYIYTTDVGKNTCTNRHGGTSAAAPLAAGLFALVLSIRPELNWRDIQHLAVNTAIPIALDDDDWKDTVAGRKFNHKYGYGKLDAYQLTEAAKVYKPVAAQVQFTSNAIHVNQTIPSDPYGLNSTFTVSEESLKNQTFGKLEHVTVKLNAEHQRRGDIIVHLISPNNITSELSPGRRFDENTEGFRNWTFMSVKHWDEPPMGEWTLRVIDRENPDKTGKLIDWTISFFGSKSEVTVTPIPTPTEVASTQSPTQYPQSEHEGSEVLTSSTPNVLLYSVLGIFGTISMVTAAFLVHRHYVRNKGTRESYDFDTIGSTNNNHATRVGMLEQVRRYFTKSGNQDAEDSQDALLGNKNESDVNAMSEFVDVEMTPRVDQQEHFDIGEVSDEENTELNPDSSDSNE